MSTIVPPDPVQHTAIQPPTSPSAAGFGNGVPMPHPFPEPPRDLISDDGEPLESDWRRLAMTLLIDVVTQHMGQRRDYFVGGNMFIYFSAEQAKNRDFRGPDFFFVDGVSLDKPRLYWAIWDEGARFPDLIIELASPSTINEDRTTKKAVYEKLFHTKEYFVYDPDQNVLEGYSLTSKGYRRKPTNDQGMQWSRVLNLWLGTWHGAYQEKSYRYLRWFDPDGNLVPTQGEAGQKRAMLERQRADAEHMRADAERQRADTERQRAESAEAQLARLRSLLETKEQGKNGGK